MKLKQQSHCSCCKQQRGFHHLPLSCFFFLFFFFFSSSNSFSPPEIASMQGACHLASPPCRTSTSCNAHTAALSYDRTHKWPVRLAVLLFTEQSGGDNGAGANTRPLFPSSLTHRPPPPPPPSSLSFGETDGRGYGCRRAVTNLPCTKLTRRSPALRVARIG